MVSWKVRGALTGALVLGFAGATSPAWCADAGAPAAPVSQEQLNAAAGDANNFLHTNGNYDQTRYFPGKQINTSNVGKLHPAWIFQTEVKESLETTPIVVDGVMYVTTSFNHVYAINAKTGEEYWHYKHKMGPITTYCCGPNNRGVAVYDDKVYIGTLDAKLVALDAKTGSLAWQTDIADPELGYSETMAPTAVNGKILIGTNGGEYGIRGFVRAYDAKTGKLDLELRHDPREFGRRVGRPRTPRVATCIAISRRRKHSSPRPAILTRRSAAACGRTRGRSQDQPHLLRGRQSRHPISTARSAPATTSIRTRSFRSISTPASMSATSSTSRTTFGISTPSARRSWSMSKDKDGNVIPGVIHGGKTGHVYVHNRKDCSLIRFSDADGGAREHVDAADDRRRPHASRRQWRRRVVADGGQSRAWPDATRSTCISR